MPTPDHAPRRSSLERLRIAQDRALARSIVARVRRGRGKPEGDAGEGVAVTPDRPLDQSGGAAAALEYGD